MSGLFLSPGMFPRDLLAPTVRFILDSQREDGEIPWFEGGHTDPWDHVESAMALTVGGEFAAARRAYRWLQREQLADGSWWAAYRDGVAQDQGRRETNFVAYVACGAWHYFLASGDCDFLRELWPTVERAVHFVLALQSRHGEIQWAVDERGRPLEDALVTGCSSIFKSLECAHNIAATLGLERPDWLSARARLGDALRHRPERFDRNWESKRRYAMDWFYPVLAGVITGAEARSRLAARWDEFVEEGLGCRCVTDQPWVTVAESCELVMALLAAGDRARAMAVYSWLHRWRLPDGSYWTGYQLAEDLLWPDEKPTWTAAAVLLAADALTAHTPAHALFSQVRLLPPGGLPARAGGG